MKNVLDEKIQDIADSLHKGNEEKEKAQLALSAVKGELHRFETTLKEKTDDVETRIAAFQSAQKKQLSDLLLDREKHHQTLLDAERAKNLDLLKEALIKAALQELQHILINSTELQKMFSEKSLGLIEEELLRKN